MAPEPYKFYKGAARAPTLFGVPRNTLMTCAFLTVSIALITVIYVVALIPIEYVILLIIFKKDPDALDVLTLWMKTTVMHKIRHGNNSKYLIDDYSCEFIDKGNNKND